MVAIGCERGRVGRQDARMHTLGLLLGLQEHKRPTIQSGQQAIEEGDAGDQERRDIVDIPVPFSMCIL